MKFIHAADIHLDSPFVGLTARDEACAAALRDATRTAFSKLVDSALDHAVDFVVIAGDLYDGDWRDYTTGLFFVGEAARLGRAGIPLFLIHGNHDARSELTRALVLPDSVYVFSSRSAETRILEDVGVAVHGRSFPRRAVTENLVPHYPKPLPGLFNVGLLHTSATGRAGHEVYAPCSLDDLRGKGYHYWALGHVHAREVLHRHPHVVFPGNLQGRHVREVGPKGFTLVEVDGGGTIAESHIACDVVRWDAVTADATGVQAPVELQAAVRDALRAALEDCDGRGLVVRLRVVGTTPLHGWLKADPERVRAECTAAALQVGDRLWLEKVELATRPAHDLAAAATRPDAVGALLRTLDEVRGDALALDDLQHEFGELIGKLPDDARRDLFPDGRVPADRLAAILDDATALVAARLLDEEAER